MNPSPPARMGPALFKRVARDPLLHFLVAGGLLFGLYRVLHGPEATQTTTQSRVIVADKPALLKFMQYESVAFQPEYFRSQLAAMSAQEQHDLAQKYVREEALFREASAIGLEDGDYVIRRRMVQKMLYLLDDAATESFIPTETALRNYFHAHEERYRDEPTVTFTQVFVDNEVKHPQETAATAARLQREMNSRRVGFDEAPQYGDRFPYLQNYIKRTSGFIESQFGAAFASKVAELRPSTQWQGPIRSNFGYHLVLLTQREPAHLPAFEQVKDQVRDDLLRDVVAAYREKAVADLVAQYTVQAQ
jgi:hypothetical protein